MNPKHSAPLCQAQGMCGVAIRPMTRLLALMGVKSNYMKSRYWSGKKEEYDNNMDRLIKSETKDIFLILVWYRLNLINLKTILSELYRKSNQRAKNGIDHTMILNFLIRKIQNSNVMKLIMMRTI